MQVSATKDKFVAPISIVVGAADNRGTTPMLGTVLLQAKESGQITMICSDTGVLAKAVADVEVKSGGQIAVDVRRFFDLIRAVPDKQAIVLGLDAGKNILTVESGRSRFRLPALPAEKYPRMTPANEEQVTITMSAQRLASMLSEVADAMGDNDTRPYLKGVLFSVSQDGLWVLATDGFRMVVTHEPMKVDDPKSHRASIMPRKTVLLAKKLLMQEGGVKLTFGEKNIQLSLDDGTMLFGKAIDGKYPEWKTIIPSGQKLVEVNSSALCDALAMLMVSADDNAKEAALKSAVLMSIEQSNMSLKRGESGTCDIGCQCGAELSSKITLNIDFLSDSARIAKANGEHTIIGISSACNAITVRPKGKDYPLSVVMPMNN
jgi:DNA polymerase-3 subunit beta